MAFCVPIRTAPKASPVQGEVGEIYDFARRGCKKRQSLSQKSKIFASCLRATPVAALTVHRTVIHYRDDASLTLYTREPLRAINDLLLRYPKFSVRDSLTKFRPLPLRLAKSRPSGGCSLARRCGGSHSPPSSRHRRRSARSPLRKGRKGVQTNSSPANSIRRVKETTGRARPKDAIRPPQSVTHCPWGHPQQERRCRFRHRLGIHLFFRALYRAGSMMPLASIFSAHSCRVSTVMEIRSSSDWM